MQSSERHDPAKTMNEIELVVKRIADFEALWRTSERLTEGCSDSSDISVSQQTFKQLAARMKESDLLKAA
jgi:hypothetical protein